MAAVKRTRNNNRWTEARWRGFVVSALRAASRRWPPKSDVLKSARRGKIAHPKLNRWVFAYRCAVCQGTFTSSKMRVDHIQPVVDPVKGWESFDKFIKRLFCEAEGLQAVCKPCHDEKTKQERTQRVKCRAAKKESNRRGHKGSGNHEA